MKATIFDSKISKKWVGVSNNRRRMMGMAPMRKSFYTVQKKAAKSKTQLDIISFCELFGL